MAREERREIEVHADWKGLGGPFRMGVLYAERVRGKELFSFAYDEEWLRSSHAQELDPELKLYSGPQYLQDERKPNFGLFLDTAPDRWGKLLMKRKELADARQEGREGRSLFETDYLLGVSDQLRTGALRFKEDPEGPFLSDDRDRTIPPWTSLRELEQSSLKLESDDAMEDPAYLVHLQKLLAPGSSLGGARPKASVSDPDGRLWVAKFPSRKDEFDVGAWEMLVHELAEASGIRTSNARAVLLSKGQHTFLSERFDRTPLQERIHFASAMTLLGYTDGEDQQEGASYLELAEFIMKHGANVKADLEERVDVEVTVVDD
jgi:serine/threonine-protein kinase HipA